MLSSRRNPGKFECLCEEILTAVQEYSRNAWIRPAVTDVLPAFLECPLTTMVAITLPISEAGGYVTPAGKRAVRRGVSDLAFVAAVRRVSESWDMAHILILGHDPSGLRTHTETHHHIGWQRKR